MAWTLLLVAGFFEIVWATLLKFTDGFTKVWPSVGTVVAMGISMVCLSFALRAIPMGTAYVVWTGIGAVGTVILGIVLFDEPKNAVRLAFIALIILGIAGLMKGRSRRRLSDWPESTAAMGIVESPRC